MLLFDFAFHFCEKLDGLEGGHIVDVGLGEDSLDFFVFFLVVVVGVGDGEERRGILPIAFVLQFVQYLFGLL